MPKMAASQISAQSRPMDFHILGVSNHAGMRIGGSLCS
jgi:hypothetical protein